MGIVPEPEWRGLADEIRGRTTLLMGRADAGKTSLARHILGELLPDAAGICFVDADVGQSSLGLPGTICMRTFHKADEVSGMGYDIMRFAGTVSPSSRIPEIISITAEMLETARTSGASTILIDTTGLVDGEAGKALKLGKIRTVKPDILIAIERENELQHILSLVSESRVYRLKASRLARQKTRAARGRYRYSRLQNYFKDSMPMEFPLGEVRFESRGNPFDIRVSPLAPWTVVGLNAAQETLALGLFEGLSGKKALIRTPVASPALVRMVVAGDFVFEDKS